MRHVQMCYVPVGNVTMSYVSVEELVIMRDRFIRVRCIPVRGVQMRHVFMGSIDMGRIAVRRVMVHVRCVPVRPVLIWVVPMGLIPMGACNPSIRMEVVVVLMVDMRRVKVPRVNVRTV